MPLHMIKLCVGVETVEDLQQHVAARLERARREGAAPRQHHQTRVMPKRSAEILEGGSLFWVIKGQVQVRQPILGLDPVVDADGVPRCHIILEPSFILTQWQARRAFQGWRYLSAEDAPADLGEGRASDLATFPPALRRELADLGLL